MEWSSILTIFLSSPKIIKIIPHLFERFLQQLRDIQMAISHEKSVFHVKTVDFLGYVVVTNGVMMNEKKVAMIKAWKPPTLVREVQIFMGFRKL